MLILIDTDTHAGADRWDDFQLLFLQAYLSTQAQVLPSNIPERKPD